MSSTSGFVLGGEGYQPFIRNVSSYKEAEIVRVFHTNDEGKKGFLSRIDFKVAFVELFGYEPAKYELNEMMKKYGMKNKKIQGVSLQDFVSCMKEKLSKVDEDDEIRHSFMAFDAQCSGFLTLVDVKRVFNMVAPHVPVHSVHSAFREIDQDGDGRVSFKDFQFLMKYNVDDHI
ncbi:EF-hand calcium-binding domain-containing protein 11 [Mactra antiquata]